MSQIHADLVFLLLGLSVGLWFALRGGQGAGARRSRRRRSCVGVELAQGLIGFVQYFTDLPVVLVGLHMLGASVLVAAAVHAFATTREPPAPATVEEAVVRGSRQRGGGVAGRRGTARPGRSDVVALRQSGIASRTRSRAPGIDAVVRLGGPLERQWLADGDRERAVPRRGREVGRRLLLRGGREVVAAEQPDGHVVEQHRPEREGRAVVAGGVGGDDGAVACTTAASRSTLSEKATSTMRSTPSGACARIAPAGSGESRATRATAASPQRQVAAAPYGADDRRAAPAGELRRERPDAAEHAVHEDRRPRRPARRRTPRGAR